MHGLFHEQKIVVRYSRSSGQICCLANVTNSFFAIVEHEKGMTENTLCVYLCGFKYMWCVVAFVEMS